MKKIFVFLFFFLTIALFADGPADDFTNLLGELYLTQHELSFRHPKANSLGWNGRYHWFSMENNGKKYSWGFINNTRMGMASIEVLYDDSYWSKLITYIESQFGKPNAVNLDIFKNWLNVGDNYRILVSKGDKTIWFSIERL